jgi:protein kinase C substrate 80K-H
VAKSRAATASKEVTGTKYGPDWVLHSLQGRCLNYNAVGFTYEVCPYGSAKQSNSGGSVNLGKHTGDSSSSSSSSSSDAQQLQLLFTGGNRCGSGPQRSLTVTLQCGLEEKLLDVTEPAMCDYRAVLQTPAVCVRQDSSSSSSAAAPGSEL